MKGRRFLTLLLLALLLAACSGRAERVRKEALSSVERALELARSRPGMVGTDAQTQAAWTEVLLALDRAADSLAECEGKGDECLAAGLSALLDADRQLRVVRQTGNVVRAAEFEALQSEVRQAVGLLYSYFYGRVPEAGEEWRGPPTPRLPGVCPPG